MARLPKGFWDEQPLGQVPDGELAERLGVTRSAVSNARLRRGIPAVTTVEHVDWDNEPLGEMTDVELARRTGRNPSSVASARRLRHIPSRSARGPKSVNWDAQPLGEVPDTHIAARLGTSVAAVCYARNKRGIAPAPRTTRWPNTHRSWSHGKREHPER